MPNTSGLITFDYVVKSYFNAINQKVPDNLFRYKQIIIEGYSDLNINHTTYVETYKGVVNDVNQMSIPPDCIEWLSVNVEIQGELWPLDVNDSIIIPKAADTGTVISFPDHFNPPLIKGAGYTRHRRNLMGEVNVSLKDRIIAFKGDFRNKDIYLIYTSSGVSTNTNTYISRAYLPLLKAYLNWVLKENDPLVGMAQKQRAEYLYGLELQKLEVRQNAMSAQELLSAIRDGYSQGVKQ